MRELQGKAKIQTDGIHYNMSEIYISGRESTHCVFDEYIVGAGCPAFCINIQTTNIHY